MDSQQQFEIARFIYLANNADLVARLRVAFYLHGFSGVLLILWKRISGVFVKFCRFTQDK